MCDVYRTRYLLIISLLCAATAAAAAPSSAPSGAPAAGVDRELVVRFTRAYGMARQALEKHTEPAPPEEKRDAMLREPDQLDGSLRREVKRIMDLNGVEQDEWRLMFARMEADDDLRRRVESLSLPFE